MAKIWKKIELRERLFSYISSPRRIPRERCKGVHFVDLGESFPTHIYLQNLASIQPRTSPSKLDSSMRELDGASVNFTGLVIGRIEAKCCK